MSAADPRWLAALDALEADAPMAVAAFRGIEAGTFIAVRRSIRHGAGLGTAPAIVAELAAITAALTAVTATLPDAAFDAPGGEGEWTVAEAIGHDADSRAGLAMAGALAAQGRFPHDAPTVVPGIPGERGHGRDALLRRIASSQRIIERAARSIAGHETDPCPLVHPLVGTLRCGEWLLFAGIHDLQHLEQLHRIAAASGDGEGGDVAAGTAVGGTAAPTGAGPGSAGDEARA